MDIAPGTVGVVVTADKHRFTYLGASWPEVHARLTLEEQAQLQDLIVKLLPAKT